MSLFVLLPQPSADCAIKLLITTSGFLVQLNVFSLRTPNTTMIHFLNQS